MSLSKDLIRYVTSGFSGLWVQTHEPAEAMEELSRYCLAHNTNRKGRQPIFNLCSWDVDRGCMQYVHNDQGTGWKSLSPEKNPANAIRMFTEMAQQQGGMIAEDQPLPMYICLMHNLQRFLQNTEVLQVLFNSTHRGKGIGLNFTILSPSTTVPPEIERVFTLVEHSLPDRQELLNIAASLEPAFEKLRPTDPKVIGILDAAAGMTRLEAENAFSLSLNQEDKIVAEIVWKLKANELKKSTALRLHEGDETFENIGGLDSLKEFTLSVLKKKHTSHLTRPRGVLLLGVPGSGKSMIAKALGNETGRKTVTFDVSALFGSLQGQTEERTRQAFRQADAMEPCILFIDEIEKALGGAANSTGATDSGTGSRMFGTFLTWMNDHRSDVFLIGTCNDISKLPAPFYRAERFDAIYFLDLPSEDQRNQIWDIYYEVFGIDPMMPHPEDSGWTGAEIRACCRLAAMTGQPLLEAGRSIIPVSRTAVEQIQSLRTWAADRCLDPESGGVYREKNAVKIDGMTAPRRRVQSMKGG